MEDRLQFVVVSDIHYGSGDIAQTQKRLYQFTNWLDEQDDIDAVFILGDVIHPQNGSQVYTKQRLESLCELFEGLDMDVSFLAGDTDMHALGEDTVLEQFGKIQGIRGRYIGLDTSWPEYTGPQGNVDHTPFKEARLPTQSFVFSHHPLVPWDLTENQWFSKSPELAYAINKEQIWENTIKPIKPQLVINGHIKEKKVGYFDEILSFSVRPFNQEYPLGSLPSGYFYVITETEDSIMIDEHVAQEDTIRENVSKDRFSI